MLCVLMTHKVDCKNFLSIVNQEKQLWDESILSDHKKVRKCINHNSNNIQLKAYEENLENFDTISSVSKMNRVYLLWVDISLQSLFDKHLHNDWIIQLKKRYTNLAGKECDCIDDVSLKTCILWMPSATVFYLPFS